MDAASTEERRLSEAVARRLRESGLRATAPRMLVMEILQRRPVHLSADDVRAELRDRGTPLQRGSVYKVLDDLTRHGLLRVADAGPGRALYEVSNTWHHHFVCSRCGAIYDVPCVKDEAPCLEPEAVPGTVTEAQIIFRGVCKRCQAGHSPALPQRTGGKIAQARSRTSPTRSEGRDSEPGLPGKERAS